MIIDPFAGLRLFGLVVLSGNGLAALIWVGSQIAEYAMKMEDLSWKRGSTYFFRPLNAILVAYIVQCGITGQWVMLIIALIGYLAVTFAVIDRSRIDQGRDRPVGLLNIETVKGLNKVLEDVFVGIATSLLLAFSLFPPGGADLIYWWESVHKLYTVAAATPLPWLGW